MAGGFNIPPSVTTGAATSVTAISATLNGTLVAVGQQYISGSYYSTTTTQRGFMWGLSPSTMTNQVIVSGTGLGSFSATIGVLNGITANTTFYYYAYATDTVPQTGVGSTVTFGTFLAQERFYKRYIYKVYNRGSYIANLPFVASEFALTQNINTVASQVTVTCAVSADTSNQNVSLLTDESGNQLTDESNNALTSEGALPYVSIGSSIASVIQNGNEVVIWEYGFYYPQGIKKFSGKIERWETSFGGDTGNDSINVLIYGDGQDLDNYLVRGNPYTYTLDQSQTSQNNTASVINGAGGGAGWTVYGQSFVTAATNTGAISVLLQGIANVTLTLYSSAGFGAYSTSGILASSTLSVNNGSLIETQFQFSSHYIAPVGTSLFFSVTVTSGQSIAIGYQNTNAYANGSVYQSNYGGGSGGGSWIPDTTSDLYFKTFSSVGSTLGTYTNQEPVAGMLKPILNDYISQGGLIGYTTSTIQTTSLSLTYKFNTQTVFEAIGAIQNISPSNFYFAVDPGTNLLTFKQSSITADLKLTKGKHLNQITIIGSIEYITNETFVTGADIAGNNIYTLDTDATSISRYGVRLIRKNDSHIQDTTTAHAVGSAYVGENKDERYLTTVTVVDKTMDINLLKVGMVIGFNGFGTFVDTLLSQIVQINYKPESAILTLGLLPHRTATSIDQVVRAVTASNTIANPSSPS